jgi:hypothetical protein
MLKNNGAALKLFSQKYLVKNVSISIWLTLLIPKLFDLCKIYLYWAANIFKKNNPMHSII